MDPELGRSGDMHITCYLAATCTTPSLFRLIILWPKYARLYKRRFASVMGVPELSEQEQVT
eukprot:1961203-Rhodomonas_salina.3